MLMKRPTSSSLSARTRSHDAAMPPPLQDIFKAATTGRLRCNPADRLPGGSLVASHPLLLAKVDAACRKNGFAKWFALRLPLCRTRLVIIEARTCMCGLRAWTGYRLLW